MNGSHRIGPIHVIVDGPPGAPWLTCLHALATDLHLWDSLMPVLARDHRVLRIDLRSHGGSSLGNAPFTIEGLAQNVVKVWDALGVSHSALLCQSIGGMIGMSLALEAPDHVTALVAADCRADSPPPFCAMFDARDKRLVESSLAGVEALTLSSWISEETSASQPVLAAALGEMIRNSAHEAYLATTGALPGLTLRPRLAESPVPTQLLVGACDGPHPAAVRIW